MDTISKIMTLDNLLRTLEPLRGSGKRIVFTNGCFDILHVGHVRYLASAKAHGDILVVGLNSDESVKSIKDEGRPIMDQAQRAEVLGGLWSVDFITIFNESDPLRLIEALKPDILAKGADWPEEDIIGGKFVKEIGGHVVRIPVIPDISTSEIIQRIAKRYRAK
jgi:D-beta-D-heptose 7-phosphate kinase/D-beta-D-heptose 1-phosphate adenosyltransferase